MPTRTRATARQASNNTADQSAPSATRPDASSSSSGQDKQTLVAEDEIDEDDCCPICQLLICNPVITTCNHTMCRSCMATWADVSLATPMTIVSVLEEPRDFDAVTDVEASCPMCRTLTKATYNQDRARRLASRYPSAYKERLAEETNDDHENDAIQTLTVYIGNRHALVDAPNEQGHNIHQWDFFVKPSRTSIIEEVQIFLHPTFRQSTVIRSRPPYEVRRLGWGCFIVSAAVILRAGYSWVSGDAEDSPDGAPKGMLRLEWMLDFQGFDGTGSMGRCRLKVKNDRAWDALSDEEMMDTAEWNRTVRAYQDDGIYEPDAE